MKAYVDSNIFVYSMFAHPKYGPASKAITEDLENEVLHGVASTLVPVEVMSVAINHDPAKADVALTSILSLPLKIFEVSSRILCVAPKLALKYRLSGYDAVHVATSLEAEVDDLISNDHDLRRVDEINLIKPLDYTEWKEHW